ncbi:MAG TPA: carboxypeptidase-like regulatory domain-containing protein, partial [Planctomycetota bacterium]|nr:carboxypeptidase-like regulatory domain-containing protein [Planctomycetota bacterium]
MVRFLGPLLAGLVVGALLGAGAFWLFGETGSASATSELPRAARTREAPAAESNAELAPAESVTAERTVARPDATALLPREISESVTALAHAVPTPKVERGTKVLSGHVTDPQGQPLAGVLVRAARQKERKPERAKRGEELAAAPTLEQRLREAVTAHYQALAEQRDTTTDGDGAYRFDELVEGD